MRLRMPNITHLESDDGSCSLIYEGDAGGSAQAGGGGLYRLRVSDQDVVTEIRAVIQTTTSFYAERHAEAEGKELNYLTMDITAIREDVEAFAEKYGSSSTIIDFYYADEHRDAPHREIENVGQFIETFCKIYLKLKSSFKYNNSEYPACGEGFYTDQVKFSPWGKYQDYVTNLKAEEAFSG